MFIDSRLLECVADGFEARRTFATKVHTLRSGQEVRNASRANGRWTFAALAQNIDPEDWPAILEAFDVTLGSDHSFRFRNELDCRLVGQSLGNAPSGTTSVQLVKTSTFGGITRTRAIKSPTACVVYQAGSPKAGTYSATTGLFTPSSAWTAGEPLTADIEFDTRVRFEADELPATYEDFTAINVPLNLIEVFGE